MKKLLLSVSFLALLAAPSFAYVQGGQLLDNESAQQGKNTANGTVKMQRWMDGTASPNAPSSPTSEPVFEPLAEGVTRPIPEPGTMILASLGLLALGASRARRRGR